MRLAWATAQPRLRALNWVVQRIDAWFTEMDRGVGPGRASTRSNRPPAPTTTTDQPNDLHSSRPSVRQAIFTEFLGACSLGSILVRVYEFSQGTPVQARRREARFEALSFLSYYRVDRRLRREVMANCEVLWDSRTARAADDMTSK